MIYDPETAAVGSTIEGTGLHLSVEAWENVGGLYGQEHDSF
jgi:hypothetical protein